MRKESVKISLDHLNFTVRDFKEAAEWYGAVFGFEVVERGLYEGRPWGVLRSGDSMLCVYESPDKSPADDESGLERFHRIYHFGLRIRDRERWEATLRERNLRTFHGSPVRYPHSCSWYVKDPTGHSIEVTLWDNDEVRFAMPSARL